MSREYFGRVVRDNSIFSQAFWLHRDVNVHLRLWLTQFLGLPSLHLRRRTSSVSAQGHKVHWIKDWKNKHERLGRGSKPKVPFWWWLLPYYSLSMSSRKFKAHKTKCKTPWAPCTFRRTSLASLAIWGLSHANPNISCSNSIVQCPMILSATNWISSKHGKFFFQEQNWKKSTNEKPQVGFRDLRKPCELRFPQQEQLRK